MLSLIAEGACLTVCPIADDPLSCANTSHPAHFWAPQDYQNFAKAFFRNHKLYQAFLKPEFEEER